MSFFSKFAHRVQHIVQQAEQEIRHVNPIDEIKHFGDHVKDEFHHIGDSIKADINHIGETAKGEVAHIGQQVKADINHAGDTLKGEVAHIGQQVKGEVTALEQQAKTAIITAAKEVVDEMKTAIGKVEHAFESGAIQKAIKASLAAAKKYPIYPSEVDLILPGGITFAWGDIPNKIDTLAKYVDAPPQGRDQIMEFIEVLAPTQLTIQETVEVELVIIGSSALEFGEASVFTAEQIDTALKHLLDDIGVH